MGFAVLRPKPGRLVVDELSCPVDDGIAFSVRMPAASSRVYEVMVVDVSFFCVCVVF